MQTLHTKTAEHMSLADHLAQFSSWSHAVSALARLRCCLLNDKSNAHSTFNERQNAELMVIKDLQRQVYKEEIIILSKGALARNNKLHHLDAFLDRDVGGRLHSSSLPDSFKHPTVIPREHYVTKLIIVYHHERVNHQGKGFTMKQIQSSGYWIPRLSQTVASYIHQCVF